MVKNVLGQVLTKSYRVDKRQFTRVKRENGGRPYVLYDLVEYPHDKRRWHVVGKELDGRQFLVSRHVRLDRARAVLETVRMAQPDRLRSPKLAHKLSSGRYVD